MSKVLDSSAVLAVLQNEPGSDGVLAALPDAIISTVNVSEIFRVLLRNGVPLPEIRRSLSRLQIRPVHFEDADIEMAASIGHQWPQLSLGDCACLALAQRKGAREVLTTDRAWRGLSGDLPVKLVR